MLRIAAKAGSAAHARARALDRLAPLIACVKRPSARGLYADRAAELFDIPPARVEAAIQMAANTRDDGSRAKRPSPKRSVFGPAQSATPARKLSSDSLDISRTCASIADLVWSCVGSRRSRCMRRPLGPVVMAPPTRRFHRARPS